MNRLFLFSFLLPTFVFAQVFYAPDGSLIIDVCGSSSYECSSNPKAPESSYAGSGDKVGSVSVGDDKTRDRLPASDSAPTPAAPTASTTTATVNACSYFGLSSSAFIAQWTGYCANNPNQCTSYVDVTEDTSTCTVTAKSENTCLSSCGDYQSSTSTWGGSASLSCPPGYTLNGSLCVLNDARAAVPDGAQDFNRDGETYSPASSNDADTSLFLNNESIAKVVGSNYQRSGYNPAGNPVHVEVVALSGGGSKIIYTSGASGSYTVQQTTYNIDSNGVITGVTGNSADGQLTVSPGTAGASLSGNPGITTPGTGGQTSSGLNPPSFPSDYAKTGEAAAAAKTITDRFDNTTDVEDPTLPQDQAFVDAFFKDTFTGLLAWQLPAHSSNCPVGSFSWDGRSYLVDAHCQLISDHWSLLSQAMAVVWILAALFIVLRA